MLKIAGQPTFGTDYARYGQLMKILSVYLLDKDVSEGH